MNTSSHPGDRGAISTPERESDPHHLKNQTLVLALGALGVVYGDIGTWFASIAALGLGQIFQQPHILLAIHPFYAYEFFVANKLHAFVVFGSVVLCLTGAEALYADLGHFGRKAIRLSWMSLAFPALLFNYFGQGALLLGHPELNVSPFYGLVPGRSFIRWSGFRLSLMPG